MQNRFNPKYDSSTTSFARTSVLALPFVLIVLTSTQAHLFGVDHQIVLTTAAASTMTMFIIMQKTVAAYDFITSHLQSSCIATCRSHSSNRQFSSVSCTIRVDQTETRQLAEPGLVSHLLSCKDIQQIMELPAN